jgi:periplasmic protein TonB
MFGELLESSDSRKKTNKSWTVVLSAVLEVAILGVLVLVPLIYMEALPKQFLGIFLVTPPPPRPSHPPAAAMPRVAKPAAHLIERGKLMAPTRIPTRVQMAKEEEAPDVGTGCSNCVEGGVPGGDHIGILTGIIDSNGTGTAPPLPQPICVGRNVQSAKIINQFQPSYPDIAKTAHISGAIVLHAVIGKDGTVEQLQYVSGPPLLMRSAMDATRHWRYQGTLLDGEPVEVDTTISVVFALGG